MIKLKEIITTPADKTKSELTVKYAKEILNNTQYLTFEQDKRLVQTINTLVYKILELNER